MVKCISSAPFLAAAFVLVAGGCSGVPDESPMLEETTERSAAVEDGIVVGEEIVADGSPPAIPGATADDAPLPFAGESIEGGPSIVEGVSGADGVAADVVGAPPYLITRVRTGEYGPCANRLGTYQGIYTLPLYHYNTNLGLVYHWDTVFVRSYRIGDYRYIEYRARGFYTTYRYKGCYGNAPVHSYYGAGKVSQLQTLRQLCPARFMTCTPGSYIYSSWRYGGW